MKLNCKGFMLAEVVVVSVVIATVLVTLFTGLKNVSSAYDTRNRYYDIDCLYAAIEVNDILLRAKVNLSDDIVDFSDRVYENISRDVDNSIQDYGEFYKQKVGDSIISYITQYDKNKMLTLKSFDGTTSSTFNDYLEYLSNNLDFTDDYDYMIIVERRENNNIDDCYYYALKLKY